MKNKVFYLLASFGIILRVYPALVQPLWLDEFYSIYFSTKYSYFQLFFGLSDVHQGGYYVFLKTLMLFTLNPFLLRLISSVIPGLISCFLVYYFSRRKVLTLIILFNPFFIFTSWSLRMYGISSLLTIILIIIYYKSPSPKNITLFTLISNIFTFSLVIPLFVLSINLFRRTKNILYIFIPLLSLTEYILFKGILTYRLTTEQAAWIASPSLQNFSSNILTSLGFLTDINNLYGLPLIISLILGIIIIFVCRKQSLGFNLFVILPFIISTLVSLLFPFLSQHFFFYKFIPKISVFFPRFLLPISIFFYYFLLKDRERKHLFAIFYMLLIIWIYPYFKLNLQPYSQVIKISSQHESILLPPWQNFYLPAKFTKTDVEKMIEKYDKADSNAIRP